MKYIFNRFYRWLVILGFIIILEALAAAHLHHALLTHGGSGMSFTAIPFQNDGDGSRNNEKDGSVMMPAVRNTQVIGPEDENWATLKSVIKIVL